MWLTICITWTRVSAAWWRRESENQTDGHVEVTDLNPLREFPPSSSSFPQKKSCLLFFPPSDRVNRKLKIKLRKHNKKTWGYVLVLFCRNINSFHLWLIVLVNKSPAKQMQMTFIKHIPLFSFLMWLTREVPLDVWVWNKLLAMKTIRLSLSLPWVHLACLWYIRIAF